MSLPKVILGTDRIQTTALGFGCGGIFRLPSPRERSRLLHTAYEAGIRHFDVAPMYGLGRAEFELGRFTRTRRAEVTIASKFGITPTFAARCLAYAQRPLRSIFAAKPTIRDQAKAHATAPSHILFQKGEYHSAGAERSLEHSLRALKTDYLDLLLLHDPLPGSVRSDDVCSYLESACTKGLIRSWGITGELANTHDVAREFQRDIPVHQVQNSIFHRSPDYEAVKASFITFGAISGALTFLVRHVAADSSTRFRWETAIGVDCGDASIAASLLLQTALRANSSGIVLFSTTSFAHLHGAVRSAETLCSSDVSLLDRFINMVNAELRDIRDVERQPN
jgi:D-threo-aldose 1-dehydrogenase